MKVFISYRRDDSSGHAGRLSDHLGQHFDADNIFMDVERIDLGSDFQTILQAEVNKCDVMLVVIGRKWLDCVDPETGTRRLDDPNDWIRIETVEALKRNIPVVPVLVDGSDLPLSDSLPQDMKTLSNRQAASISDNQWRAGVEDIIRRLEAIPRRKKQDEALAWLARVGPKRIAIFTSGILVLLAVIIWQLWPVQVQVPSVIGKPLAQAQLVIEKLGLTVPSAGVQEEESLTQAPGIVIKQIPPAGLEVTKGESVTLVVTKLPPPVDLSRYIKIRNTGSESAVAGLAAVNAIEVAFAFNGNSTRYSERYLYEKAKLHDELHGVEGTWMKAVVYVAEQFGVPAYNLWPYKANNHSLPRGVTWDRLDKAAKLNISKFHRVSHIEDIYKQLRHGHPVVAGVRIIDTWYTKKASQTGHIEEADVSNADGLSAVTFVGFDPASKILRFANVWGDNWGDKGFGTMSLATARVIIDSENMWAVEAVPQASDSKD